MDNKELISQVTEKAQKWLSPEYDEATRNEVKAMLDEADPAALIDAFYTKILSLGQGGYAALWEPAPTA